MPYLYMLAPLGWRSVPSEFQFALIVYIECLCAGRTRLFQVVNDFWNAQGVLRACDAAMYSASHVLSETVRCFWALHEIGASFFMYIAPECDRLSMVVEKYESVKVVSMECCFLFQGESYRIQKWHVA